MVSWYGFSCHWYADDTENILSFPTSDSYVSVQISVNLTHIASWMEVQQVKLRPSKTELLFIPGDVYSSHYLVISLYNSQILPPVTAWNLVVTTGNQLSFLPHKTDMLMPGSPVQHQRRSASVCHLTSAADPEWAFSNTLPLLHSLHWLPVIADIRFKTLMLVNKSQSILKLLPQPNSFVTLKCFGISFGAFGYCINIIQTFDSVAQKVWTCVCKAYNRPKIWIKGMCILLCQKFWLNFLLPESGSTKESKNPGPCYSEFKVIVIIFFCIIKDYFILTVSGTQWIPGQVKFKWNRQ